MRFQNYTILLQNTCVVLALFGVLPPAFGVGPENDPMPAPTAHTQAHSEERNQNLSVNDIFWREKGDRYTSKRDSLQVFYDNCTNHMITYAKARQSDDPNCGLPKDLAPPFLNLCREFTKGLKQKVDKTSVIAALATLNKPQVIQLSKTDCVSDNYITLWTCLVPEFTAAQERAQIIPLIANIDETNIRLVLNLVAAVAFEDGETEHLLSLLILAIGLTDNDHCVRSEHYMRIFGKYPEMSTAKKLAFLKKLATRTSQDVERFVTKTEEELKDTETALTSVEGENFVLL